jgi:hypothetical protein
MKKMRVGAPGVIALVLLVGCSNLPPTVTDQQLARLRTIEVSIDVPPDNFLYVHSNAADRMPFVAGAQSVPFTTVMAANFLALAVIMGVDQIMAEAWGKATLPIGDSVKDLDVRAMVFGHLQSMSVAAPNAPAMTLSTEPFPKEEPMKLSQAEMNAPPGSVPKPSPPNPLKPMRERAMLAKADASLFITVWPMFKGGGPNAAFVQSGAWLYDRSGNLLYTSATAFIGPRSPAADRPELVRWWADGKFRRVTAHGARAVTITLGEDLFKPELAKQRRADMKRILGTGHRIDGAPLREAVPPWQESTANAERTRSTMCAIQSLDRPVIYRYDRHVQDHFLAVSAYCPDEKLDLWSHDLVKGMSWLTEPLFAPALLTTAK